MPEALHCPSCGAPLAGEPPDCAACGYRPQTAREYLWLSAGGLAFLLVGFLVGGLGVAIQGAPPRHWSGALEGWFPIGPWGGDHHWLSFLVAGIGLTLAGMGITRRMPAAWLAGAASILWMTGWTVAALAGVTGPAGARAAAAALLPAEALLLLLAVRIGISFTRTPPRGPHRLRGEATRLDV